jgi:hypothetical protein
MATIYDSSITNITANGSTTIDLEQGARYAVGIAGTFDSASITLFFVDGSGNDIPVPSAGSTDGGTSPLTIIAAALFEIAALTAALKITVADIASAADLDITVTKIKD